MDFLDFGAMSPAVVLLITWLIGSNLCPISRSFVAWLPGLLPELVLDGQLWGRLVAMLSGSKCYYGGHEISNCFSLLLIGCYK